MHACMHAVSSVVDCQRIPYCMNKVYGSSFAGVDAAEASDFLPTASACGVRGLTVHNYPYARRCTIGNYTDKRPVTGMWCGRARGLPQHRVGCRLPR